MKVLYFALWYPHKYDAMSGLFVRKHAQAASRIAHVAVVYVCSHPEQSCYEMDSHTEDSLQEIIVYYPFTENKFKKIWRYAQAYRKGLKALYASWGKPDLVHANVMTRTAVVGYWVSKRLNIPYVITEHWSRYLPENLSYKGSFRKRLTNFVARRAQAVMPVSVVLQDAMRTCGIEGCNYIVVPNVVDDFFYEPDAARTHNDKCVLLHVSCFDERSKNTLGMVEAVSRLWQQRQDFKFVMVGTGTGWDDVKAAVQRLSLEEAIELTGEQTPTQVKQWFDTADAFVLFSNYETAAVVLSESVATGTPIISTPVGVALELVNDETGILVPKGDIEALSEAMSSMIDHYKEYDAHAIRNYGNLFSMASVSEDLNTIYKGSLEIKK